MQPSPEIAAIIVGLSCVQLCTSVSAEKKREGSRSPEEVDIWCGPVDPQCWLYVRVPPPWLYLTYLG